MSCDHQLITDYLIDYLEGNLGDDLRQQCDAAIKNCSICSDTVQRAQTFSNFSTEWQSEPVPKWHRMNYLTRPTARPSHWLNWSAIATSCVAILLVVFRLEISTDNGLLISFGGGQEEERIRSEITAQLEDFKAAYEYNLNTKLAEFSNNQNIANRLLMSDWTEQNRQAWRQDLELLTTSWENQRFSDKQQTSEQFSYLTRNQIESDQVVNQLLRHVDLKERGSL